MVAIASVLTIKLGLSCSNTIQAHTHTHTQSQGDLLKKLTHYQYGIPSHYRTQAAAFSLLWLPSAPVEEKPPLEKKDSP